MHETSTNNFRRHESIIVGKIHSHLICIQANFPFTLGEQYNQSAGDMCTGLS